jgi:hypothetical protein
VFRVFRCRYGTPPSDGRAQVQAPTARENRLNAIGTKPLRE